MRSRLSLLAGLILAFAIFVSFTHDDDPLKVILSKIEHFRGAYPQEKVHLHLDKPYYAIGDDIWFKAYVVNAEAHQLSGLSKVLNVELINEQDSVAKSLRLPLIAGVAWGDFHLSDSLQEGNYRIRAYTNYMRNFDSAYFFDKTIRVGNAFSNDVVAAADYKYENKGNTQAVNITISYLDINGNALAGREVSYDIKSGLKTFARGKAITDDKGDIHIKFDGGAGNLNGLASVNTVLQTDKQNTVRKNFPLKAVSNDTDVQFFPESGNLVTGLRSKVAFKALGADGLGKIVSGYVSDNSGEKVSEFKSEHAGMGVFVLQPAAGQNYTATINFPDGSEKKVALPKPQPEGFVLGAVNADSTNLLVKISASPAMVALGGEVTLVAQSNSVVKFVSKSKLESPVFSANIPKSKFATGILQLTLFNQQNQPVAERLVFINHNDFLEVGVNGPKVSAARKKVKIELDVKDPAGKPTFASMSVAVTDATKASVNQDEAVTILSNLLLTSDIKGYVEQPNYYFNNTDAQKVHELDNLLLTQGWRRFTWKAILNDNLPKLTYQPEDGITISGRVTKNKKPVVNGKVLLLSSKKGFFVIDTVTDADGRFAFKNLVFTEGTRFIVQAQTDKDKKFVELHLDSIPPQMITRNTNTGDIEVNVNRQLLSYLKNNRLQYEDLRRQSMLNRNIMLNEVKVVAHPERHVKGSASLAREANYVVPGTDLEACSDILSCLQGRVPGFILQKPSGADQGIPYLMRSMNSSITQPTPMSVFLDGVYLTDPDEVGFINPADVEGVEIIEGTNAAIYGLQGTGGVIVITTKLPGSRTYYNPYTPGKVSLTPKGYYQAREFYSPNYDAPKTSMQKPDLRSTVLWQPNVIVKNGKAAFEYFNADGKGPYQVTIEGIDDHGNLARKVYEYDVN